MLRFSKNHVVTLQCGKNMGVTKSDLFTETQNKMARMARVLGHPARIAIIEYLLKANACVNGELVEELGLAQATISQHLRELKEIGIIQGSIEGSRVSYCINPATWKEIQNEFNSLFTKYEDPQPGDCC